MSGIFDNDPENADVAVASIGDAGLRDQRSQLQQIFAAATIPTALGPE
jgi:hypothetical protein